jgi:ABC-type phosphonate transport system ATPase subunit
MAGPDVSVKDAAAAMADANKMAEMAASMHGRLQQLIKQVEDKLNMTDGETKKAFMDQMANYQSMAMDLEQTKNNLAKTAVGIVQQNVDDDNRFAKAFGKGN